MRDGGGEENLVVYCCLVGHVTNCCSPAAGGGETRAGAVIPRVCARTRVYIYSHAPCTHIHTYCIYSASSQSMRRHGQLEDNRDLLGNHKTSKIFLPILSILGAI